ncbi:GNAT family N-acetyltransferase [Nocardioides sp. InS609-2]|uniref:GNAT family N-acetyltransferase n=1 Tax=Nocardioides sp. InS609-2 TaxID=2760705 RepID=UPI0020BEE88C|nr:GNAT family N-acetyltransferase [Nocardioides sp. InS609-2]
MTSPAAYSLRPVRESDHDAVGAVIEAAFGDEGPEVSSLWTEVRQSGYVLAELVAVDARGDEVVGHVGVSHAWLDARRELVDVAMLSPLSTRPDRQEQGIGTTLIEAAIEAARATGRPMLCLEGSPFFYGVRGFERAALHGLEPPSRRTPEQAFQVVLLPGREDWMTGRLVYPDVWWRHEAAGLRDPDLAHLEELFAQKFKPLD